ncbi:MAG: UDP-3-O-(3-hydroxymyristoyl)glucosamine N-acyltransferase [Phycisphaerales bacterium]|nr:UDP-3-O-(3-hydroxymyristoyl)glucosamine N-acyltransferase [Phycisphaerales bacterium]
MSVAAGPVARTAEALARELGGELQGDPQAPVTRIDTIDGATTGSLSFIRTERFAEAWVLSKASVGLISQSAAGQARELAQGRALILVPDADLALVRVLEMFAPREATPEPGVHSRACVAQGATIAASASIGPNCTIGEGAHIGDGCVLVANVFVGRGARVGAKSVLHPGVRVLDRCEVGERCLLHPGVTIGADGFGYRPGPGGPVKVPHIGNVVIGNEVEIGANTCVDRAKFGSTTIGDKTKIDNLVQVGHNCRIGRACLICGQCGISGSVKIGDGVIMGGAAAIADNLEIGDRAQIAACSGVMNNIPPGEVWIGIPAGPAREYKRNYAAFRMLGKMLPHLKRLMRADEGAL